MQRRAPTSRLGAPEPAASRQHRGQGLDHTDALVSGQVEQGVRQPIDRGGVGLLLRLHHGIDLALGVAALLPRRPFRRRWRAGQIGEPGLEPDQLIGQALLFETSLSDAPVQ